MGGISDMSLNAQISREAGQSDKVSTTKSCAFEAVSAPIPGSGQAMMAPVCNEKDSSFSSAPLPNQALQFVCIGGLEGLCVDIVPQGQAVGSAAKAVSNEASQESEGANVKNTAPSSIPVQSAIPINPTM
jgi:hypothetical protein